jgi:hypothetical protein
VETILSKEFEDWTPVEKRLYRGPEELAAKLVAAEANFSTMVQDRSVLIRDLSHEKRKAQDGVRVPSILLKLQTAVFWVFISIPRIFLNQYFTPWITNLEGLKGIPMKEIPGCDNLTPDVFNMSVDRDKVYEDLIRFYIERERIFAILRKSRYKGYDKRQVLLYDTVGITSSSSN